MYNDDALADYLAGGAKPKGAHFLDRFTHRVITNLLYSFVIPWIGHCLSVYTESDFHQKMLDPTFDFIQDWKLNHPDKYPKFIKGARRFRNRFTFDVEEVLSRVTFVLQTEAGWVIYPYETLILRSTIMRVRDEIYA